MENAAITEKAGWDDRNELVMTKDNMQAATDMHSLGISTQFLSSKALRGSALTLRISSCI